MNESIVVTLNPQVASQPVRSPAAVGTLVVCAGPLDADFLLVLVDSNLALVGVHRLPPRPAVTHGIAVHQTVELALRSGAAGVILAQERAQGPITLRRADFELTQAMRGAVEETDLSFLDHLIVCGDEVQSVGGISLAQRVPRGRLGSCRYESC